MKIALGSVVKGFDLKMILKQHLEKQGHKILDVGCYGKEKFAKYTSVGQRVAEALQTKKVDLAINCCGSGTGASLSTSKFKGVCAISCESVKTARMIRVVNGANCLCMGEDVVTPALAIEMADAFVNAKFQDAQGVPAPVLAFWQEARNELMSRGDTATPREIEGLA